MLPSLNVVLCKCCHCYDLYIIHYGMLLPLCVNVVDSHVCNVDVTIYSVFNALGIYQ